MKPSLAMVFSHFSHVAQMAEWREVEQFVNPRQMFASVHVLALGDDRDYPTYQFDSVRVHRFRSPIPGDRFRRLNDILLLAFGTAYLWWLVKRLDIDLIAQVDSTPLKYGLPAVFVGRRTGLPSLITLQSDYEMASRSSGRLARLASRFLWPYVLRRSTLVRSVSRTIAGFALEHGVPEEKIRVIPNKENLAVFRDPPPQEALEATARELGIDGLVNGSVVFLSVGRLIEVKNLERCIRAFARAAEQEGDLAYLIVGRGPLLEELENLARTLGVADRVRFLGYFPHELLARIYHLSDVFLFPTLYEGNPRVVLEAMAAGLPIICSDHGAVTELVGPEDGIRVDPTDLGELTEAVLRVARDPELRASLSVHSSFDPEAFSLEGVNALEADAYAAMLNGSGAS